MLLHKWVASHAIYTADALAGAPEVKLANVNPKLTNNLNVQSWIHPVSATTLARASPLRIRS
jgi:hypothetical protein